MNPNRHFGLTAGLENYDIFIVYRGHSRHVMNTAFEFSLDKVKLLLRMNVLNDITAVIYYSMVSSSFFWRKI